jgi:hypothetical protein
VWDGDKAVAAMSKQLLGIEQLTNEVLAGIRACEEGKDVAEISIYEIESDRLDRNWGVSVVAPGRSGMVAASRAAISVMLSLGRRFDLSVEE